MKELKKNIKRILKEGLLEGKLPVLESFIQGLYDEAEKDLHDSVEKEGNSLFERLRERINKRDSMKKRLLNPQKLNSLGDYIFLLIQLERQSLSGLCTKSEFTKEEMKRIIKNHVDITSVDLHKLVKLVISIGLTLNVAKILLQKSISLFQMNPSVSEAMARYDYKDGQDEKAKSIRRGVDELLLLAGNAKEFEHQKIVSTNIPTEKFLANFEREFKNVSTGH